MTRYFLLWGMVLLVIGSCNNSSTQKLTIAASSNTQFVLDELIREFEETYDIKCEKVIGSSGKLLVQIKQGAPFDIFLSADLKYPQALWEEGLGSEEPSVYALGKLVVWSNSDISPSFTLNEVNEDFRIAIANPQLAPYGLAAQQYLENSKVYDTFKGQLVFGESISQVNQFIVSGAVQMGFTAKSVVIAKEVETDMWTEIDNSLYEPIRQGALILNHKNANIQSAELFMEFLLSEQAKNILSNFGYGQLEDEPSTR